MAEEGFRRVKFLPSVTPRCVHAAYARSRPQQWIRIKFDEAEIILCDRIDLPWC